MTPENRTIRHLKDQGHSAWKSCWWYRQRSYDLGGFIDIVSPQPERGILAIQATTGSHVSTRVKKILGERISEAEAWLRSGGLIEVWGWRKLKRTGKWEPRIVPVTLIELHHAKEG